MSDEALNDKFGISRLNRYGYIKDNFIKKNFIDIDADSEILITKIEFTRFSTILLLSNN